MKPGVPFVRLVVAGLVWIAIFALLFSVGDALELWPPPPEGGFHGTDLVAGLAFGVVLLLAFVFGAEGRARPPGA